MRKSAVITGIIIAAAAAVVVLPKVLRTSAVIEEAAVPIVAVQKPQAGTIELKRSLVGKIEPSDVIYIYPKMAGEITEVFVKTGDVVTEGEAICTIDTKMVDSARLNLEAAQISLDNANATLERQRVLYAAGDISAATFEQVEAAAKSAQIQYDSAKLNYDTQMEYSNITATIGGTIESCEIEVRDMVSQQNLVCVIAGEGTKAVSFSVTEKVAGQLQVGDAMTVTKNGMDYDGTITDVSNMVDAQTGLFYVKASVEGEGLTTGSTVNLSVTSDKAENVMTLPVDVVYYSGGNPYVYTCENGTVHRVPITVGIYDSELVQILDGITEDTEVITTWSSELFEGSVVQTMQTAE